MDHAAQGLASVHQQALEVEVEAVLQLEEPASLCFEIFPIQAEEEELVEEPHYVAALLAGLVLGLVELLRVVPSRKWLEL